MSSAAMGNLLHRLEPLRRELAAHPMYGRLQHLEDARVFMRYHVFAVWDFMALLKALQRHLTCTESNWTPTGTARIRRLINEMVLEEESDEIDGVATSHFELYRAAMREAGADVQTIDAFLARVGAGADVDVALAESGAPAGARAFVRATFATIALGRPHAIAAAFALGREDAIPNMFGPILGALREHADELGTFELYLNRHIELDGGAHSSMASAMLEELCGQDGGKWEEAADAAARALTARIALWEAIEAALPPPPSHVEGAMSLHVQ